MTQRQLKLFEIRAKFTIKQQQATQLKKAIEALVDKNLPDDTALEVAEAICNANIGP